MHLVPSGSSPRLSKAKPTCAGDSRQTLIRAYPSYPCQSVFSSGSSRRSPSARAIPDYFFKDHKPSAKQGEARLCGRFQTNLHPCLSVISVPIRVLFRLFEAKPACASYTGSLYSKTISTQLYIISMHAVCCSVSAVRSVARRRRVRNVAPRVACAFPPPCTTGRRNMV